MDELRRTGLDKMNRFTPGTCPTCQVSFLP